MLNLTKNLPQAKSQHEDLCADLLTPARSYARIARSETSACVAKTARAAGKQGTSAQVDVSFYIEDKYSSTMQKYKTFISK